MTTAAANDDFKVCLSYRQASAATSASRTTLYRLVRDGMLETRKVRGRVFITRQSLEKVFGPQAA